MPIWLLRNPAAPEATDAAIERLLAAGRLRPSRDPGRVFPTLHDYQARPETSDPRERPFAERYVAAIATLCGRTTPEDARTLAPDRGNVMTALALWRVEARLRLLAGQIARQASAMTLDAIRRGGAAYDTVRG